MPTHQTTDRDRAIIAKYLLEAHGKERQLETALKAQIAVARRPGLDHALREHLEVTREQVDAIEERLDQLGADTSTSGLPLIGGVVGLVGTVANKGLALAKGPLVVLRGTSPADRELRAMRDCYWNEAEEIAHYRVIEAVAEQLGDQQTAELARRHREQEVQMQASLEGQLPAAVRQLVAEETPASERPSQPTPTPRRSAARRSTTSHARSTKASTSGAKA